MRSICLGAGEVDGGRAMGSWGNVDMYNVENVAGMANFEILRREVEHFWIALCNVLEGKLISLRWKLSHMRGGSFDPLCAPRPFHVSPPSILVPLSSCILKLHCSNFTTF